MSGVRQMGQLRIFIILLTMILVLAGAFIVWRNVFAIVGSGTNTVSPSSVTAGSTGNQLTFTFTPSETMDSGGVVMTVPADWSVPQGTAGVAGYTTATSATAVVASVLDTADSATGWSAGSACANGLSADSATKHEGTASIRCQNGNESNNDRWYKNISAQNWTNYTKIGFWIYSSSAIANSDLRFGYDDSANLASPIEQIPFSKAISANTWTYVVLTPTAARTSVVSYGFVIRSASNLDNVTVRIDDILVGPGIPTFSSRDIQVRLLQAASGNTISMVYGSGGGASGAAAPTVVRTDTFTTQSRTNDGGALIPIISSPTVSIGAAAISQFSINDVGSLVAGNRAAYTVTRKDQYGNSVTSGTSTVYLYSNSTGNDAFYSVSSGGSPITSIAITPGNSTANFWYYDDKAGSPTVTVSDNASAPDGTTGIDDATDSITVSGDGTSQFVLNAPVDIVAGNRAAYTVTRKDAFGNLVTSGSDTVYLYSSSTGNDAFYNVESGGSPITSIAITDGNSTANFWYYDDKVGSWDVTVSDNASAPDGTTGIDDAIDSISVSAAATSQFLLNDPGNIEVGNRAAYVVTRKDAFGNLVTSGSDTVYLYSNSTGNDAFYSVESGGSPIISIAITDGNSTANFWYYDDAIGSPTISVSDNASAPDGTTGIDDAIDSITVSAGGVSQFTLNAPADIAAGNRAAYVVTRKDVLGNAVTTGSDTVYLYSNSIGNDAFYNVESGGSPITSIAITDGNSTANFWYYDDKVGSPTVTVSDNASAPDGATGIDDATDSISVSAAATSQFTLNAPADIEAGTRAAYTVTRKDAFGNLVTSGSNTVYFYSSSTGNDSFYSVESGGSPITSIAITNGNSTANFWYYDDKVGSWDVIVSDNASAPDGATGIDDATDGVNVFAGPTRQFLLNDPGDLVAGNRVGYTVTRKDAFDNLVTSGTDTVYLYSNSIGNDAFYSVSSGGSPITSIAITDGNSTANFWYYDDKAGSPTVTVSDNASAPDGATGIDDATDSIAVSGDGTSQFILNAPVDIVAGTRAAYVVTRKDAFGNLVTSGSDTVYLYSSSTGNDAFYNVESGGSPITSITITDGNSTANFWYYDDKVGSWDVTVSDNASAPDGTTGIDDATDSISVSAAATSQFLLNDPGNIEVVNRAAYVVTRKDAFGNLVTSGSNTVYLYSSSTGNDAFYNVESGGSPITSIAITDGNSVANFWYYDDTIGSPTISVSDNASAPDGATGIDDATDSITVSAGGVSQFTLNAPVDIAAGARAAYTVTRKDVLGNAVTTGSNTVYLYSSSTGNDAFYSVSSGGSPITSIAITDGNSVANFWYYDDKAGSWDVTVSDNASAPDGAIGIDDATDSIAVSGDGTSQFVLSDVGSGEAGVRAEYSVTRKDSFGNSVTSGSDTVYLYSDSTGNDAFYSVASGGSPITSIAITDGNSSVSFWYYDDKVGNWEVSASDNGSAPDGTAGIDDGLDSLIFLAGSTQQFLLDDPGDMTAGDRLNYTVTRQDAFGNLVTSGTDTVYLYGDSSGSVDFYDSALGGSPISSIDISGGSSIEFWYYDDKSGSWSVEASDNPIIPDGDTGVHDAIDAVVVNAGATSLFSVDDPGNMIAGSRIAYTISRSDAFGNLATSGSNTVYLYSTSTGTKAFYDAGSGGSPIASVAITGGNSSVNVWYFDTKVGDWSVTASDNSSAPDGNAGINDGVDSVSVSSASTYQFFISDPGNMTVGTRIGYSVMRKDQYGNSVISGAEDVYLYSSSTGGFGFYDVALGGGSITLVSIADGNSSADFWYEDSAEGLWTITVSDNASAPDGSSGVIDAEDAINVFAVPIVATKFIIVDLADSSVGSLVAVTVHAVDDSGNLDTTYGSDVTLAASGSATGEGLVDIVGGVGTVNITDTVSEIVSLSLIDSQGTGLNVGSTQNVFFAPGAVSQFLLNDPGDIVAGNRAAYSVTRKDQYGNAVTSGSSTVYLYSSSTGSPVFYDALLGGSVIASIVISDGNSVVNFWYFDSKVGSWNVIVSDSALAPDGATGVVDAQDSIAISAAGAGQFLLNDPGDMSEGTRLSYSATRKDSFGNLVTSGSNTVYLYSSSTGGKAFYNASSGGSIISSIEITDGNSSVDFWYFDDTSGTWTVTASDSGGSPDGAVGVVDATDVVNVFSTSITATRFIILDPADATIPNATTVTINAVDDAGNLDTTYENDVTLIVGGSATGGGLVDMVGGVGSMSVNDAVEESVLLSLLDSEITGLDVSSTQTVTFGIAPVAGSFTGGGAAIVVPLPTILRVSGLAYPGATVRLRGTSTSGTNIDLKDITVSESDGSFALDYQGPFSGITSYDVIVIDPDGSVASSGSFTADIVLGQTTQRSVLAHPTVRLALASVLQGVSLSVAGFAVPWSWLSIFVDNEKVDQTVQANADGAYNAEIDTRSETFGTHTLQVKQITSNGTASELSPAQIFVVSSALNPRVDLSGDGKINVVDWSIFLFRWPSQDPEVRKTLDFNGDGKVDLADFSVFIRVPRN